MGTRLGQIRQRPAATATSRNLGSSIDRPSQGRVGLNVVSEGRTANHMMATTNPTKISIEKKARPVISIPSNGQDDVSHLLLRLDVPGRLDHVLQAVAPVDHGPVLSRLDQFFEEEDVLLRLSRRDLE